MGSSGRVMEKPSPHQELLQQQQQKQQEQALKCPRCESTNTKFCYYNNYSLSQPRHFCKACKRYWTRGGTLRNVPAGGGFRRNNNKRLIKRSSSDHTTSSSPLFSALTNPAASSQPQIIASASTSTHVTPMFDCDVNLPFTSRFNYTISSSAGYDILQPRMNALGLGFPSGFDKNGSSNSYYDSSIFGSNYRSSSNSSPVMMPDFLMMNYCGVKDGPADGSNNIVTFEGLAPPQMVASSGGGEAAGGVVALKDVKVEAAGRQNQMMEHVGLYNPPPPPPPPPNSLYHYNWNNTSSTPMVGIWNDNQPNNIGPPSSLTSSLI